MSKFLFPPSIPSRPTYGVLERRDGIFHIIIAEDEGAEAIIDFVGSDKKFLNKAHIIFVATKSGEKYVSRLKSLSIGAILCWAKLFSFSATAAKSFRGCQNGFTILFDWHRRIYGAGTK
jgi:hypothetical protein